MEPVHVFRPVGVMWTSTSIPPLGVAMLPFQTPAIGSGLVGPARSIDRNIAMRCVMPMMVSQAVVPLLLVGFGLCHWSVTLTIG